MLVLGGRVSGDQSEFQGGRKGPKKNLDGAALQQRRREWDDFNRYLVRPDSKLDAIVDGANVGYYETNYAGAPKHVDYQQIDWIVQHFVDKKEKGMLRGRHVQINVSLIRCLTRRTNPLFCAVLVFLNARHVSRPLMPPSAEPLVASWRAMDALYTTPRGMNDDWFWLHAALVKRSFVVTNDEMRDHHFQMLAQRGFLRWKDSRQVHFRFGAWIADDGSGQRHRSVELAYPDPYSRRMQRVDDGLVIPMPKRGDENRFLDGVHEADESAPIDEMYVCIRPNSSGG
jgi:Protein-only RNase P